MPIDDPQTLQGLQALAGGASMRAATPTYAQVQAQLQADAADAGVTPPVVAGPAAPMNTQANMLPTNMVGMPAIALGPPAPAPMPAPSLAQATSDARQAGVRPQAPPGGVVFRPEAGPAPATPGAGLSLAGIAAPAQNIPAAWIPRGRETQTQGGVEFDPETKAALERFGSASADVERAQADALKAQQAQDQATAAANLKQAQADTKEFQVRKVAQQAVRDEQWGKMSSVQRSMEEAQAKGVDPGHWWANKDTGSKVMMFIGALAGGWLVGTGRANSNPTLDTINREIDRDIDAQKSGIAGKERSFENQMSLYGLARQKGLDEDSAADAAKLLAHQQLDAQLKAAMPDAQNALGKLALAKSIQDNQARIAQLRAQFDEKASARVSTSSSEAYRPAQTAGGVTPQAILKKAQELYEKNMGKEGNSWEEAVRIAARGLTGRDIAPGAPEMRILEQKGGAAGRNGRFLVQYQANVQALNELAKLSQGTFASPAEAARATQLLQTLKANGVAGLPEDVGMFSAARGAGTLGAAIDQARRDQAARLAGFQAVMGQGGGAATDETPEGFEGDE